MVIVIHHGVPVKLCTFWRMPIPKPTGQKFGDKYFVYICWDTFLKQSAKLLVSQTYNKVLSNFQSTEWSNHTDDLENLTASGYMSMFLRCHTGAMMEIHDLEGVQLTQVSWLHIQMSAWSNWGSAAPSHCNGSDKKSSPEMTTFYKNETNKNATHKKRVVT